MTRLAVALIWLLAWICAVQAQEFQPGGIYGNPGASRAAGTDATLQALINRAPALTLPSPSFTGVVGAGATFSGNPTFSGNLVFQGTIQASGLPASGTVANSLCSDSSGNLLSIAGINCFAANNSASALLDTLGNVQGDILYRGASAWVVLAPGTAGQVLQTGGAAANPSWLTVTGTGSVTSVAMTVPSILSVSGSPITTAGTLAVTLATESANTVFAGPTSGGAVAPTFRALVAADIGSQIVANSSLAAMANNTVKGNNSGGSASPSDLSASNVLDMIGNTQGNVLYRGASAWAVLAPGTAGQVLQTGGAAANPSWATVSGTGTVTSIAAGYGLTGGTITTSGTLTNPLIAFVSDTYLGGL